MSKANKLARAETTLKAIALRFPGAYEEHPWGESAFKVNKKVFTFLSIYKGLLHLTVKLPITGKMALGLPFAMPTGYGLGKSGWVTARFAESDEVPLDLLEEWIDESYRAIAPKKLVAALGPGIDEERSGVRVSSRAPRSKKRKVARS